MKQAQTFSLRHAITEDEYTLSSYLGKAVMLTFWTSWCPDSRVDLSLKQRLYQSMDHSKLEMLMINVSGRERMNNVGNFVKEQGYTFPVLLDDGRTVYDQFKCAGVPTTVCINADGQIVATLGEQATFQDVTNAIATLLA
ncbi:TlpA disulfide reductase family protein [Alkalihalobacillus sp. FSL R5-0424]